MKKIYLRCWLNKNFGDDLFLKIITDRYKKTEFMGRTIVKYEKNQLPSNFRQFYINSIFYSAFNKISHIFNTLNFYDDFLLSKSDAVAIVGGSIFMESQKKNRTLESVLYNKFNKKYYILGANVGPVYTKDYIDDLKNVVFKKAEDVSLRDKKSYSLVNECQNVRYHSDLVFSLNINKYRNIAQQRMVIFSVIDCDKKRSQIKTVNTVEYEKKIVELIEYFQKMSYKVQLMSFCKYEGDETAIERIIAKCVNSKGIEIFYYDGNIEKALKNIASSEIIVGTRFHANVLGLIFGKTIIPISYNDKTDNLLSDINYKGKQIKISEVGKFNIKSISKKDLTYKCNIKKQKVDSLKHFEKLDLFLAEGNDE